MPRQSAAAQGYGGQAERQNPPLSLKKDGGRGCEETDFIRREELLSQCEAFACRQT